MTTPTPGERVKGFMNGSTYKAIQIVLQLLSVSVLPFVVMLFQSSKINENRMTSVESSISRLRENIDAIVGIEKRLIVLELKVAVIEGNRLTTMDGVGLRKEIADLWQQLAKIPEEIPPAWFLEQVRDLETRLTRLENKK
jgi:hypothetical protein